VTRLAYLVSHPIQYQAPLLRMLSQQPDIQLKAFFGTSTIDGFADPGFGTTVKWDVPLLDGYAFEFLPALFEGPITSCRPFNVGFSQRLKDDSFDVLWVHGYTRLTSLASIIAAKRRGLRIMLRDEANGLSSHRTSKRRLVRKLFYAFLSRITDAFLAIGTLNHDYYCRLGISEEKIFLVPYAVDNLFFHREANSSNEIERLRCQLGLRPERPVILFVGKLVERKAPLLLLEAYQRLAKEASSEPSPYLLFAGDGELRGAIEETVLNLGWHSVKVLGFKNQSELPALYELCDLFVLPSSYEPWGLVVNEVMNAGKPIIVSDHVGCWPDLVCPGLNGAVFPAGDVSSLSSAISSALSNRQRLARMGEASRSLIKRWSFNEDLQGIRAALQYVMNKNHA
jgi:glycosyltransferase involved in cell wall biosynthesis